jgi:hypothetical protein
MHDENEEDVRRVHRAACLVWRFHRDSCRCRVYSRPGGVPLCRWMRDDLDAWIIAAINLRRAREAPADPPTPLFS